MTLSSLRAPPWLDLEWVWVQAQCVYPGILQEGMSEKVTKRKDAQGPEWRMFESRYHVMLVPF